MATVYKAHDLERGRVVAIKVLSAVLADDARFCERFEREAQVLLRLRHPHIVPVEDFGNADGYAYLVMPYLRVGSLAERLRQGPLTPVEGARLIDQLARALDCAHSQGIVHRDVKPSNVLLTEEGSALLSDFGLAQIQEVSTSLTGSGLIGTPMYMSPEQARGDRVDARSDQYSLGVLLYELATAKLPFEADTPLAVLIKHLNAPLPLPRAVRPTVPEAVERVILKALAKNPADRFASVCDMNRAFQAAVAHALNPQTHPAPQIELAPDTTVLLENGAQPPTRPGIRRRARLAVVGAAALLLLLACPIASNSFLGLLDRAARPAESSGLPAADLSAPQLTAQAATIEALTTKIALQGGLLSADQVQTAVALTMVALGPAGPAANATSPSAESSATPTPLLAEDQPAQPTSPLAGPTASQAGTAQPTVPSATPAATHTSGPTRPPASATPGRTNTPVYTATSLPTFTWTPTSPPTSSWTPISLPTSTRTSPPSTATPWPTATSLSEPSPTTTPLPSPTPTTPAVTLVPTAVTGSIYLHNNPSPPSGDTKSQSALPMDLVSPLTGALFNYDKERDGKPGLVIKRSDKGFLDSDSDEHQTWKSGIMAAPITLSGAPQLIFWSAIKDFKPGKSGAVAAQLTATNGGTAAWSVTGSVQRNNWHGATASWVETNLTFSSSGSATLPAGYWLELTLIVPDTAGDDMWFAYDTGSYPTRITWP